MAEVKKLRCAYKTNTISRIGQKLQEAIGAEVVCEERMMNNNAILLCFEDFYFRNKSYSSLSIVITETERYQEAVVVGFGGGEGLFNISWGANGDFADRGVEALVELGFKEVWYTLNNITNADTEIKQNYDNTEEFVVASNEEVFEISQKLLEQNKEAYEELAKWKN